MVFSQAEIAVEMQKVNTMEESKALVERGNRESDRVLWNRLSGQTDASDELLLDMEQFVQSSLHKTIANLTFRYRETMEWTKQRFLEETDTCRGIKDFEVAQSERKLKNKLRRVKKKLLEQFAAEKAALTKSFTTQIQGLKLKISIVTADRNNLLKKLLAHEAAAEKAAKKIKMQNIQIASLQKQLAESNEQSRKQERKLLLIKSTVNRLQKSKQAAERNAIHAAEDARQHQQNSRAAEAQLHVAENNLMVVQKKHQALKSQHKHQQSRIISLTQSSKGMDKQLSELEERLSELASKLKKGSWWHVIVACSWAVIVLLLLFYCLQRTLGFPRPR